MGQPPQTSAQFGDLDLQDFFARRGRLEQRSIIRAMLANAGLTVKTGPDADRKLDLAIDMLPPSGAPDPLDWFVLSRATAETDLPDDPEHSCAASESQTGWLWAWIMGAQTLGGSQPQWAGANVSP